MKRRRILIDGYNLGLEKGTGVATYARNLSRELTVMGHEVSVVYGRDFGHRGDPLLREIGFFDPSTPPNKLSGIMQLARGQLRAPLGQSASRVPITGSVIADSFQSRMPVSENIYNAPNLFKIAQSSFTLWRNMSTVRLPKCPDIAHWTYPMPIRVKGAANIYTLHDLVPLRLPYTTLDNKRRYLALMKKIVSTADHIVTVSECSRRDIIELLEIEPERVTNTYQSVSIPKVLLERPEQQVCRDIEGVSGLGYKEYFLFWGSIEPKKNVGRIIESYLASGASAPLLIVGAQAWKSDNELRMLKDKASNSKGQIIHLNYLPFNVLVSLIRGAKACLFPSLYEGFGLPVLESMILKTPVICSNTSSLLEVAGNAALMVDPYDSDEIAMAIRTLDADAELRSAMSELGILQASRFSPEKYRAELDKLYIKVA